MADEPKKTAAVEKQEKLLASVADLRKQTQKAEQELNKYQAIPKSNTGETLNLGNAPTPDPIEPTVNEPGNVYLQSLPDAAPAPKK